MSTTGRLNRLRQQVVLAVVVVGALAAMTMGGAYLLIGAVGGGAAVAGRLRPVTRGSWRGLNIAVLVGCVVVGLLSTFKIGVGLVLVGWLQVHRSFTGRQPADDRVAILLALLQVLLACVQSLSGYLAPLFAAFAMLVPLSLLLTHLVESAPESLDPTTGRTPGLGGLWGVGPFTVVLTVLLFFGLPRIQVDGIPGAGNAAGLGDKVRLGDLGTLKDNPALALRATVRNADGSVRTGPFYFRGTVFDDFDGETWTSTFDARTEASSIGRIDHPAAITQEIALEPLQDGILVGIPGIVRIELPELQKPSRDPNGAWRQQPSSSRITYTVWSVPLDEEDRPEILRRAARRSEKVYLAGGAWSDLPENLDPRVGALAERLVTEAGVRGQPAEEARVLEQYLRTEFGYTLVPEPTLAAQPLSGFLFESRRGHCEYFATALAVMLRTRGIPARVVGGYYGGEPNPFADWVLVRQSDAHAWVEARVGDRWMQLDATPAADTPTGPSVVEALLELAAARWQDLILDYSLENQVLALLEMGSFLRGARLVGGVGAVGAMGAGIGGTVVGLVGLATVLIAVGLGLRVRLFRSRADRVTRELRRARTLVRRRGWEIPVDLPPVEAATWLVDRAGAEAEPLLELSWMHYEVRYGPGVDSERAADAREAYRALQKALPARRRG